MTFENDFGMDWGFVVCVMRSCGDDAEFGGSTTESFLCNMAAREVRRHQPISGSRETAGGTALRGGSGTVASRLYLPPMSVIQRIREPISILSHAGV